MLDDVDGAFEIDEARTIHPWDGYLTGPENALATASACALARGGKNAFGLSPLIVHGAAGVGKSRLLAALVAERLLRHPEAVVAHVNAETFAADCARATSDRNEGWTAFRSRYRMLDLLVIDDFHELERFPWALEELTYTLDALESAGGCVVLAGRMCPGRLEGWPPRLLNRLTSGLSAGIETPGAAMLRRYALERAGAQGLTLTAEAVDALAQSSDGFRILEGRLAHLELNSRLKHAPIDQALVQTLLDEERTASDDDFKIDLIARAVAVRFGVKASDLKSVSRRKLLVEPRQIAILLTRRETGASWSRIGAYFGGRDPATLRHAVQAASLRLAQNPALAASIDRFARRELHLDRLEVNQGI